MSDDRETRWPMRFIVISVACALSCLSLLFAEFKAAIPDDSEYTRLEALATDGMAPFRDQCTPYHAYRRSGYLHPKDNLFVQSVAVFYHCDNKGAKERILSEGDTLPDSNVSFLDVEFLNAPGAEPIPLPSEVADADVVANASSTRGPRSLGQWVWRELQ